MKTFIKIAFALMIVTAGVGSCFASIVQVQDESKGIQAEEYVKKRPKGAFTSGNGGTTSGRPTSTPKRRVYRRLKSGSTPATSRPVPNSKATEIADIGFTIWKFDPSSDSDDPKALKEVDPRNQASIVGRRLSSENRLAVGDLVRIAIESGSHDGHLYVINREKYRDGTFGKPKLIFPTLGRGSGRNFVQPGVLMYFPSPQTYFEVTTDTATTQDAEELIVIISRTEMIDPARLRPGLLELPDTEVAGWLKKWNPPVTTMELDEGAGETMTVAEHSAGDQQKGLSLVPSLTQTDAVPQTLLRVRIKRGEPILARIELKINSR